MEVSLIYGHSRSSCSACHYQTYLPTNPGALFAFVRAFYRDGKLVDAGLGGGSGDPKPSAANDGTLITVSIAS